MSIETGPFRIVKAIELLQETESNFHLNIYNEKDAAFTMNSFRSLDIAKQGLTKLILDVISRKWGNTEVNVILNIW